MELGTGVFLLAVTVMHFSEDPFISVLESSCIVLVKDVYIVLCCGSIFIHFELPFNLQVRHELSDPV